MLKKKFKHFRHGQDKFKVAALLLLINSNPFIWLQQTTYSMNRRIRFGLIFVGPSPVSDGSFLRDLGIKHIEGCSLKGKHYVLFTLDRAKKSNDILRAVEEQNRINHVGENSTSELEIELLMASEGVLSDGASTIVLLPVYEGAGSLVENDRVVHLPGESTKSRKQSNIKSSLVAVFDKGHSFQSHEISRMIHMAKLSHLQVQPPPIVGESRVRDAAFENQPSSYWSWTSSRVPDSTVRKRAIDELASDLVEGSIKPSAQKRMSPAPKDTGSDIESEVFGVRDGGDGGQLPLPRVSPDDQSIERGAPTAPSSAAEDIFEAQVVCKLTLSCFKIHN